MPNTTTIYEVLGRHPVHPFPARMAPGIALQIISRARKRIRILDPMMGSGTVLALARSQGHRAIGVDIDPLAVLITRVWTTAIDAEATRSAAERALERARSTCRSIATRHAYPAGADDETKSFVRYWFDPHARRQLASLAAAIARVRNDMVRDVLWCAFSRLIITKQAGVSLAMDLAHSRPHKRFERAPIKPFDKFLAAVERVVANCLDLRLSNRGPAPVIREGDARKLRLADNSVDLVLTSPPYLNAIDYIRCSKFSLVWMGYSVGDLRLLRGRSVGAEVGAATNTGTSSIEELLKSLKLRPQLRNRERSILTHYIQDLKRAIDEVERVLAPGGVAVFVVGENTVRGTFIPNSKIIEAVAASAGLRYLKKRARSLPANRRYLPPPDKSSANLDNRMRREVVITFAKPRPRAKR